MTVTLAGLTSSPDVHCFNILLAAHPPLPASPMTCAIPPPAASSLSEPPTLALAFSSSSFCIAASPEVQSTLQFGTSICSLSVLQAPMWRISLRHRSNQVAGGAQHIAVQHDVPFQPACILDGREIRPCRLSTAPAPFMPADGKQVGLLIFQACRSSSQCRIAGAAKDNIILILTMFARRRPLLRPSLTAPLVTALMANE